MPEISFEAVENTAKQLFAESPYQRRISALTAEQLSSIDTFLQSLLDADSDLLEKTHFFNDRFENLYLKDHRHPELLMLIEESRTNAADMLKLPADELSISYWFNLMQPGHVTTLHRHDDWDELISGVIYLSVPRDSGNLVLQLHGEEIELEPVCGNYIYFDPTTPHAVRENRSPKHRLSIGMNIGLKSGLQYQ